MSQEYLSYAGQVIVDSIYLISGDGRKKLDLRYIFDEIDIHEDIFSSAIVGEIRMLDGYNLPSTFPIIGEEIIQFVCHTPTLDTSISKNFMVTGISDQVIAGGKNQVYTITFASIESVVDLNLRVYNAFAGKPSDSAVALFKKFFPSSKIRKEDSGNVLKVVAPSVTPFKMMNYLASKSMSTNSYAEPTFLFYEDNQQFNFVSLSGLFSQKATAVFRWSYSQQRIQDDDGKSTRDINAEYANLKQEPFIDTKFNVMDNIMNGSMGHKVFEVDIVRKTIGKRTYSYVDDFAKTPHLNKYPVNTDNFKRTTNAVIDTTVIHPAHHEAFHHDREAEIASKRQPLLATCEFIKMDIVVNGRTNMKCGDVITFQMGQFATSDNQQFVNNDSLDPYYSGNYLIGAIKHRFTQQRHECVMQIFKESFPNQIGKA